MIKFIRKYFKMSSHLKYLRSSDLTLKGPRIVIYCYNIGQQDALFINFALIKNSTCFGQTYCRSSAVLILYSQQLVSVMLVMLTVCWRGQDGTSEVEMELARSR